MEFAPAFPRAVVAVFGGTALLVTALLTGCASTGNAGPRTSLMPVAQASASLPQEHGDWPDDQWAARFGDPQLQALTAEAVAHSPSLQAAMARVEAARALADQVRSGLYPQLGVEGGFTRERVSQTDTLRGTPLAGRWFDQARLSGVLSYDVDFWGKHREALRSALSEVRVAEAEQQAARLLLTTSVARVYVNLATQYALRDVLSETMQQRQALAHLTQARLGAGLDTEVTSALQHAGVASLDAQLTQTDDDIALTRHQLAALLGKGPDRGLAIGRPQLLAARTTSQRLPDDARLGLLSRRPDLVAAKWRVEAASRGINVARAAFLPDITLNAMAGLTTITPSDFLLGASRAFSFGPALTLPVFEGGRLRANLAGQYAAYDAAVADYNQTLTDALRETADAVGSLHSVQTEIDQQGRALGLAEHAWQLARARWQAGLADQIAALDAEAVVLDQRQQAVQLRSKNADLQIALIWSLGGGYLGELPDSPPGSASASHASTR